MSQPQRFAARRYADEAADLAAIGRALETEGEPDAAAAAREWSGVFFVAARSLAINSTLPRKAWATWFSGDQLAAIDALPFDEVPASAPVLPPAAAPAPKPRGRAVMAGAPTLFDLAPADDAGRKKAA